MLAKREEWGGLAFPFFYARREGSRDVSQTAVKRFSFANLVRVKTLRFDWRSWAPVNRKLERDPDRPPAEVLDKLIETEIIPRLMLANREAAARTPAAPPLNATGFDAESIDRFARRTITADPDELSDHVQALLDAGVSHEDALLKLLAPAARRLGDMWAEDLCDFTEVTVGLMKLHRVMQRMSERVPAECGAGGAAPRILLAPALGEQHLLGVLMVGEFFSRSGWNVRCEPHPNADHLASSVSEEHFDVVGLSASTHSAAIALASEIRQIRAASANPNLIIMVGGPVFNDDVGLARRIGADATAIDGVRAVVTAERLIHKLAVAQRSPH